MNSMKGLYIHIPFCKNICSYCDFYKMVAKDNLINKYVDYLIKEIELRQTDLKKVETIYLGGGTPSSLAVNLLEKLFIEIGKYLDLKKIKEFSVEANPNDITTELLMLLKKYHVNRISLGVQSFNERRLIFLNRIHRHEDVKRAMTLLKENGFHNINIDLIYGLPYDSFAVIENDLQLAKYLGATHISAYSLILEEKTILMKRYQANQFTLLPEDEEAAIYQQICAYLKQNDFIHYEISNFALKNFQSKHNLLYWDNMNYIGVGANASSYLGATRFTNIKNLNSYFEGIDQNRLRYVEYITLTLLEQMKEHLMLGLRKIEGVNISLFKVRFQADIMDVFPIIHDLIQTDLLAIKDDYLFIPQNKLYISNEVLVNFI